eukprot:2463221-Amphidinium_carterae.1
MPTYALPMVVESPGHDCKLWHDPPLENAFQIVLQTIPTLVKSIERTSQNTIEKGSKANQ